MKYFVFYDDDYPDNDGVGLVCYEKKEDALAFVTGRMAQNTKRCLNDYTLIHGDTMPMKAVNVITKIEA